MVDLVDAAFDVERQLTESVLTWSKECYDEVEVELTKTFFGRVEIFELQDEVEVEHSMKFWRMSKVSFCSNSLISVEHYDEYVESTILPHVDFMFFLTTLRSTLLNILDAPGREILSICN